MKINKLRMLASQKGFTLIELMIVIAIIGILAAIAIPNFISYRDKSFCSAAETDAGSLQGALADYFAIPSNRTYTFQSVALPGGRMGVQFPGSQTIQLSGTNTAGIASVGTTFGITVTDGSARCPLNYQASNVQRWSNTTPGTYRVTM